MRKDFITDLAVLNISEKGFVLIGRSPDVSIQEIKAKTASKLIIEGEIKEMELF